MSNNKETTPEATAPRSTIDTTVGELICAIADAAREASISDKELAELTRSIFADVLRRYQQQPVHLVD